MSNEHAGRLKERWARLRFSIVGPLLAAPPPVGQLVVELRRLSEKLWLHPSTEQPRRFGFSTIQRWYYAARRAKTDPVGALGRKPREDRGRQPALNESLRQRLRDQHHAHPSWSYQLHTDNLAAQVKDEPELGTMPSYATVRRFMKRSGLVKRPRRPKHHDGVPPQSEREIERREVRSFEAEHANVFGI